MPMRPCVQSALASYRYRCPYLSYKRVAQELGENMTDEELQEMISIDEADRDGDGEVNEEAPAPFRIMKRRGFP